MDSRAGRGEPGHAAPLSEITGHPRGHPPREPGDCPESGEPGRSAEGVCRWLIAEEHLFPKIQASFRFLLFFPHRPKITVACDDNTPPLPCATASFAPSTCRG